MTYFSSSDSSILFSIVLAKSFFCLVPILTAVLYIPLLIYRPSAEAAHPNAWPLYSFDRASAEFAQAREMCTPPFLLEAGRAHRQLLCAVKRGDGPEMWLAPPYLLREL